MSDEAFENYWVAINWNLSKRSSLDKEQHRDTWDASRADLLRPSEVMLASALAHRTTHSAEHDPANGKLHGYCIVCGVPWPCETAAQFIQKPRADSPNTCPKCGSKRHQVDMDSEWFCDKCDGVVSQDVVGDDNKKVSDPDHEVLLGGGLLEFPVIENVDSPEKCMACNGSGGCDESMEIACGHCNGTGERK